MTEDEGDYMAARIQGAFRAYKKAFSYEDRYENMERVVDRVVDRVVYDQSKKICDTCSKGNCFGCEGVCAESYPWGLPDQQHGYNGSTSLLLGVDAFGKSAKLVCEI
jgi:hypothetical protein